MLKKTAILACLAGLVSMPVMANEKHVEDWILPKKGVQPVTDPLYQESCGECHFAYQPGWLPSRSWEKLMQPAALEDHFGENAELDEAERKQVLSFLKNYAAETSWFKRSKKVMSSVRDGSTPMRITDLRYIKHKHDEIPKKMIEGNDKVRALSFCDSCHTKAKKGRFNEDSVKIPGYGWWEDD